MCGIVGYLGDKQNPSQVILSGLRKLEYRGYDSAGLAILTQGGDFVRVRASGKLKNLEDKLLGQDIKGSIGIGHTRWATHGAPLERNAHPHQVGAISLVHNGIIENYQEIRDDLLRDGAVITSDTDSELVAHLMNAAITESKDLKKAVISVKKKLKGAYSILVMWKDAPDQLIAFKDGPPLVIGLGNDECFVASDVQALIQYTNQVVYLRDQEIALIERKGVQLFDLNGQSIEKKVEEVHLDIGQVEKMGYSHFMLKEIYEQPMALAGAIKNHIQIDSMQLSIDDSLFEQEQVAAWFRTFGMVAPSGNWAQEVFKNIDRVFIVACGTSYYAGQVGKYLIEKMAKLPVETDVASEFRYRDPVLPARTLLITISQSGETADTLAAIRLAKKLGALTLSLCNVKGSSIDREAAIHLYMQSGPEIGVASTKAFVSTLAMLNIISLKMAEAREQISAEEKSKHLIALMGAPSLMEGMLAYDKWFKEASRKLIGFKGFLYLARGFCYPIAMEGALKLKELAYLHAEGYAAGEMKHGPLALIDENMGIVVIAPDDDVFEKTLSNMEEARARGGKIISISTGENEKLKKISEYYISIPKAHPAINPILCVLPLQLMAFHIALSLGHDVDQPRNLAKSVTVE